MVHVVIDRYFSSSLFLKGLKIFLNPRLSLIVPFKVQNENKDISYLNFKA